MLPEPKPAELELFEEVLLPLSRICRPALDGEQVIGYFHVLGDLPAEAVFAAAMEIASSRTYPAWPMPGEIRAVAARALAPQMTAGEAWKIAQVAARQLRDPWLDSKDGKPVAEWNDAVWAKLPLAVATTLRIFGSMNIGKTQAIYANFRDEYERQVVLVRRPLMLPAAVKPLLARLPEAALPKFEQLVIAAQEEAVPPLRVHDEPKQKAAG